MTTNIKALKKVINDLDPIYTLAAKLRDEPLTYEENVNTVKTLCDQLSLLADGLQNYINVISNMHVSKPLEDFMAGLHAGQRNKS